MSDSTYKPLQLLLDESDDFCLSLLYRQLVGSLNAKVQLAIAFFGLLVGRVVGATHGDASLGVLTDLIQCLLTAQDTTFSLININYTPPHTVLDTTHSTVQRK